MKISRRKLLLGVGAAGVLAGGAAVVPMINREGRFESTKSRVPAVAGTEGKLPESADAVIIGAGLQGIMTAINLAEKGLNVVICEKGVVGGEQSVPRIQPNYQLQNLSSNFSFTPLWENSMARYERKNWC